MKSFTKILLSSLVILNTTSLLAVNPALPSVFKKGEEALGEELGGFGKKATPSKTPVIATAAAYSPVGTSSSSAAISGQRTVEVTATMGTKASVPDQVLRLRGGGPKKQFAEGLKSTGESNEEARESNMDDCFGLTLEDFQGIIFEYPASKRLIIQEGAIVACDADPKTPGKNRSENMQIMQTLMELLPEEIAKQELAQNGLELMRGLPLSSEKLKIILQKVNEDVGILLNDLETQSTATGYTKYTQSYFGKEIMSNLEETYKAKVALKTLQENQNTKDIFAKLDESVQQTHTGSSSLQLGEGMVSGELFRKLVQEEVERKIAFDKAVLEKAALEKEAAEKAAKIAVEKAAAEQARAEALHIIATKRGEVEGAFVRARQIKVAAKEREYKTAEVRFQQRDDGKNRTEYEKAHSVFCQVRSKAETKWKEAETIAQQASDYWKGVVEKIKIGKSPLALSEEEASTQRNYFLGKVGIAKLKKDEAVFLNYSHQSIDKVNSMVGSIRYNIWPTVAQAMKAFIAHPNEITMLAVREAISVYATACAYVSAIATTAASACSTAASSSHSGYTDINPLYRDREAIVYGSASVSTSIAAAAYAYALVYGSSSASACACTAAAAYASASRAAYNFTFYGSDHYEFGYRSEYGSTSKLAFAFAPQSTIAAASLTAITSKSAPEAFEVASMVDDVINDMVFWTPVEAQSIRETADFAHAVARYKEADYREQEEGGKGEENPVAVAKPVVIPEWKLRVEEAFTKAKTEKSESAWRAAAIAAREAATICQNSQNTQGMSREEVSAQQNFWSERAILAKVKAHNKNLGLMEGYKDVETLDWSAKLESANDIMRMIHQRFGSPVSNAMKEFMAHPSEATLRATGKSSMIAMNAAEAEEALEAAEIFANTSIDAAALGRKDKIDAVTQGNIDWTVIVTREVAEFARAVAVFKRAEEAAKAASQP